MKRFFTSLRLLVGVVWNGTPNDNRQVQRLAKIEGYSDNGRRTTNKYNLLNAGCGHHHNWAGSGLSAGRLYHNTLTEII